MALDFLGSGSGNGMQILQSIPDILNLFGAAKRSVNKTSETERLAKQLTNLIVNRQPTAAETRANSLYEALLQPNNSLVGQMTDEENQNITEDMLSSLSSAQRMDQRAQSLGRKPGFFNPERADESIAYALSRSAAGNKLAARNNARSSIEGVANALIGRIAPNQNDRQSVAIQQQMRDIERQAYKYSDDYNKPQIQNGLSGLQDIFDLFKGGGQQQSRSQSYYPKSNTTVYWN